MEKVMQTVTGYGGNCESAVIATLLGLTIDEVPSFWVGIDTNTPPSPQSGALYQENLNNFLRGRGFQSISLGQDAPHTEWVEEISRNLKGVPLVVGGMSPRGFMHAVIYRDGVLWHDPHPEGGGVVPYHISFIVPTFGD